MSTEGAMVSTVQPITQPTPTGTSGSSLNAAKATGQVLGDEATETTTESTDEQQAEEEIQAEEQEKLESVKQAIEEAMQSNPDLADLAENLLVDMTPEGLRIQVVDSQGKPMFPSASARMFERTRTLLKQVGQIIQSVPNEISIRGHTDSVPFGANAEYTNWELSSDRANASRRVLKDAGVPSSRLNNVAGMADTQHLVPDDPSSERNRRISIVLLKEELTDPEAYQKRVKKLAAKKRAEKTKDQKPPPLPGADPTKTNKNIVPTIPEPESKKFKRTDGAVQFP